jgi:hypothetical protein
MVRLKLPTFLKINNLKINKKPVTKLKLRVSTRSP